MHACGASVGASTAHGGRRVCCDLPVHWHECNLLCVVRTCPSLTCMRMFLGHMQGAIPSHQVLSRIQCADCIVRIQLAGGGVRAEGGRHQGEPLCGVGWGWGASPADGTDQPWWGEAHCPPADMGCGRGRGRLGVWRAGGQMPKGHMHSAWAWHRSAWSPSMPT